MKLSVEFVRNVKPGDTVVGEVDRSAPTRPVQPFAQGMTVHHVLSQPAEGERFPRWVLVYHPDPDSVLRSRPRKSSDEMMVIR